LSENNLTRHRVAAWASVTVAFLIVFGTTVSRLTSQKELTLMLDEKCDRQAAAIAALEKGQNRLEKIVLLGFKGDDLELLQRELIQENSEATIPGWVFKRSGLFPPPMHFVWAFIAIAQDSSIVYEDDLGLAVAVIDRLGYDDIRDRCEVFGVSPRVYVRWAVISIRWARRDGLYSMLERWGREPGEYGLSEGE